jgi:hypothetical protein
MFSLLNPQWVSATNVVALFVGMASRTEKNEKSRRGRTP